MKRITVLLLLAALWLAPATAQDEAPPSNPVFDRIEQIVTELADITGFAQKHPVPYATISRDELKEFLERRVQQEINPEDIRIEQLVLRKFGFVPRDFDLRKTMIALYTEQAAAFYDFHDKKLYLLESSDDAMQESALVHELAHALADQNFRLEPFLEDAGSNDDGALARVAVMEGQATWLMAEVMARNLGQSMLTSPEMVRLMTAMLSGSSDDFPVFNSAPLYIRQSLVFPYTAGMKLQQAVVEKYGKRGFGMLFERPPSSTREVIHPEVYLAGERSAVPQLPKLRHQRRYRRRAEGTVGEFDYAVLLEQYLGKETADRLAPAWRGGAYRLLESKSDDPAVLLHSSIWESEAAAGKFFDAYREILEDKWDRFEVHVAEDGRLYGVGEDGYFTVRRLGRAVIAVEGMRSPDQVKKWPPQPAAPESRR